MRRARACRGARRPCAHCSRGREITPQCNARKLGGCHGDVAAVVVQAVQLCASVAAAGQCPHLACIVAALRVRRQELQARVVAAICDISVDTAHADQPQQQLKPGIGMDSSLDRSLQGQACTRHSPAQHVRPPVTPRPAAAPQSVPRMLRKQTSPLLRLQVGRREAVAAVVVRGLGHQPPRRVVPPARLCAHEWDGEDTSRPGLASSARCSSTARCSARSGASAFTHCDASRTFGPAPAEPPARSRGCGRARCRPTPACTAVRAGPRATPPARLPQECRPPRHGRPRRTGHRDRELGSGHNANDCVYRRSSGFFTPRVAELCAFNDNNLKAAKTTTSS